MLHLVENIRFLHQVLNTETSRFLDYFDRYLLLELVVECLIDTAKASLAQLLHQVEPNV